MADDNSSLRWILLGVITTAVMSAASLLLVVSAKFSEGTPARQKVIEPRPELGKMEKLGTFTVNLADTEENHYLRADAELELNFGSSPLFGQEISNRKSQLRDLMITTLSAKTAEELRTPEGKEAIKQELKERINSVLAKGQIARVYFTEFSVQ